MSSNLNMEFDYTEEAVEQLKKLIEQEKVTLLNTYEDSLKCIKIIREII